MPSMPSSASASLTSSSLNGLMIASSFFMQGYAPGRWAFFIKRNQVQAIPGNVLSECLVG